MATQRRLQTLSDVETTCEMLLNELQEIWDDVGENDEHRDHILSEIEQECLEVYRRKVDHANKVRASLHQSIAEIHSQIVAISVELGDRPPVSQVENKGCSLKEYLSQLKPILDGMKAKKDERLRILREIGTQIQNIHSEICPNTPSMEYSIYEKDLTQKKLDELQSQLKILQKEKDDRLTKVSGFMNIIHDLCIVLGCDFFLTVREVHPTLDESSCSQPMNISDEIISRLESTIQSLKYEKRRIMQQIQDVGTSLVELWNLMDTPLEEQQQFHHVTCNIAASEDDILAAGALSMNVIEQAELEVQRLESLKASKMKELVLKKRAELEELCRKAHIIPDGHVEIDKSIASMESGMLDPTELLATIEEEIGNVKEEALSRKEIMDKIDKWLAACEEESWLEEYNKDENRYSATRGAHLNLKRAERARTTVNKIPAMVDTLIAKTMSWEEEMGKSFIYDGVRLLSTLEEYNILRIQKEEERRRQRDQKKLHEQEILLGTRPSPNSKTPLKKGVSSARINNGNNSSTPASRRISFGGPALNVPTTPGRNTATTLLPSKESRRATQTPNLLVNRVLVPDEDNLPYHDVDYTKHQSAQQTDLPQNALTRVPLSPVSTPVLRSHANTERDAAPIAVKDTNSLLKSPPSTLSTTTSTAEKNATTRQTASQESQSHQELSMASSGIHELPSLNVTQDASRPREYSFEEKRLVLMYHHHLSGCR